MLPLDQVAIYLASRVRHLAEARRKMFLELGRERSGMAFRDCGGLHLAPVPARRLRYCERCILSNEMMFSYTNEIA
ncbi:hypothetical protein LMTR13_24860 [Bradyrhizobium icense]|uniref:Uncharacterized protein n=1 Tax=Bradyrhizobium icense TaxID=1274631 RepID=A0A1B1UJG9_9BRAD|nr:hypothetical protein LMTR13_24860 [Bradyrhizobium icense]